LANIAATAGSKTILMSAYLFQIPAAQTQKKRIADEASPGQRTRRIVKRLID
jgi:hypothetical protein